MLNFNDLTQKCVDSVITNAGMDCSILVVDDGSKIPFHDDRVTTLRFDEPNGNTHSMNAGIDYFYNIGGVKYIYNLDNDIEIGVDAIKELVDVMELQPNLASASSARVTEINGTLLKIGRSVDLLRGAADKVYDNDETALIHWAAGCATMLRTSVIREIGMFDKRLKNYCGDAEWQLRALCHGYTNVIVPKSVVRHLGEVTMHANLVNNMPDEAELIRIISGSYMQEVLKYLPLDAQIRKYGKITFDTFIKPPTT